jgi:O-antigen/teichoic acid export membrane protein
MTGERDGTLPAGTYPVGIGLLLAGVSTYVFFKIGQQALGQDGFKPLVAMWFITFALVPGFLLPIEQEVSRALAHRHALGEGGRAVLQRAIPLAVGVLLALLVGVALLGPTLRDGLFEGSGPVVLALGLALAAYAPFVLARGICSGHGRFAAYGTIVGADAVVRVAATATLWVLGVDRVGPYAVAVALSPLAGVALVGLGRQLGVPEGPPAPWSEITANLSWLVLGALFAAALLNAGPITVDLLDDDLPAAEVTRFGNAVILARVPLFLFQAVQAALLPRLATLAARRDLAAFRDGLRRLMVVVTAVGVLGVVAAFAAGPFVLELIYDGGVARRTLTMLALASATYMAAVSLAQATIALSGHAWVALGWLTGFATFAAVVSLADFDIYLRVESALVASSLVALACFSVAVRRRLAGGPRSEVAEVPPAGLVG